MRWVPNNTENHSNQQKPETKSHSLVIFTGRINKSRPWPWRAEPVGQARNLVRDAKRRKEKSRISRSQKRRQQTNLSVARSWAARKDRSRAEGSARATADRAGKSGKRAESWTEASTGAHSRRQQNDRGIEILSPAERELNTSAELKTNRGNKLDWRPSPKILTGAQNKIRGQETATKTVIEIRARVTWFGSRNHDWQ
jgi:hypothetical protein